MIPRGKHTLIKKKQEESNEQYKVSYTKDPNWPKMDNITQPARTALLAEQDIRMREIVFAEPASFL